MLKLIKDLAYPYKVKRDLLKIESTNRKREEFVAEVLSKCKTPNERINFFESLVELPILSLKKNLKEDNTIDFFIKAIEDDEVFTKLLKHCYNTNERSGIYFNLTGLGSPSEENFKTILKLVMFADDIRHNYLDRYSSSLGYSYVCLFGSEEINKKNEYKNQGWYKIAQQYCKIRDFYMHYRFYNYSSENFDCFNVFIKIWMTVFDEEVQDRVTEIISSDNNYFSLENIYELSILGYKEKMGETVEFSIFDTPNEWILSLLKKAYIGANELPQLI